MSFIKEFFGRIIANNMADQKSQDEAWHKYIRQMKANGEKAREPWILPLKSYGYWNGERANASYHFQLEQQRLQNKYP